MKKHARSLVALTFLLGLGVTAKAESGSGIVVNMPFAFVVSGKTLPAGTYTASRLSDYRFGGLRITSRANGTSILVLPNEVEGTSADKPNLTFRQIGEERFLSAIQTEDEIYNIPVSRSVILEASAKPDDTVSVSVSGGSK
jgi:hypothetical protein